LREPGSHNSLNINDLPYVANISSLAKTIYKLNAYLLAMKECECYVSCMIDNDSLTLTAHAYGITDVEFEAREQELARLARAEESTEETNEEPGFDLLEKV
jgi:hypothetical protein